MCLGLNLPQGKLVAGRFEDGYTIVVPLIGKSWTTGSLGIEITALTGHKEDILRLLGNCWFFQDIQGERTTLRLFK